jgi:hypothetical protein
MKLIRYLTFIFIAVMFIQTDSYSQVLISTETGSTTPDESAMLEIESTSGGVLIPRMTTSDRNKLDNGTGVPTEGLLVYDETVGAFFLYSRSGWVNLARAEFWETNSSYPSTVSLSSPYTNVGIGTDTSKTKLVVQADPDDLDTDVLFEVKDKAGVTIFEVTSGGVRAYVKDNVKGVAGGFAVGKYGAAKGTVGDLFVVTSDSTRVYTDANGKGISGGFAVGKYGAAKDTRDGKYFFTNGDSTRVYTDASGKGISGGFAVGKYGAAKDDPANAKFSLPVLTVLVCMQEMRVKEFPEGLQSVNTVLLKILTQSI